MTDIKEGWQDRFIAALSKHGVVTSAAASARISRKTAYELRGQDEAFAARWADAIEQAADVLEREAFKRAHTGVLKPIYQGGKRVGSVREYSDTLLIFLLKGARPGTFRENHRVELSGLGGGPIPIREILIERPTPGPQEEE